MAFGVFLKKHSMKEAQKFLLELFHSEHRACTDTRLINPGDVFFALKGDSFDGNLFARQALEKGASIAVVDQDLAFPDERLLTVENVLETLQKVSQTYRQRFSIPVIGITGTNGKTTTKELMSAVLSTQLDTLSTSGNLNNHIGVPLTLLELRNKHQVAVIEMGANHIGEIGFLSSLADPDFGLITNVGKAHIEGFGSAENIVIAKTELYKHIIRKQGTIFVNGENTKLTEKAQGANLVLYGTKPSNHLQGEITGRGPRLSFCFKVMKAFGKAQTGMEGKVNSKLVGDYNLENFLAAITIGLHFGVSPENAIKALEEYTPSNHRSQLAETGKNTVILDAYNANPTSMGLALKNLASMPETKKAAIIGDMLELGITSQEEHQKVLEQLFQLNLELNIVVGPEFCKASKGISGLLPFENVEKASEWIKTNELKGYTILVKGSRGIKMEKVMDLL